MFQRAILHLDMDAFFVSVELLRHPELRGRPLIIGGSRERGVVTSASYEARQFGIRSAMPMHQAMRLCPGADVLPGDFEEYSRRSREVTLLLNELAPMVEKASIDEFYVDLSGMDRYFGCWKFARELRRRLQAETGLPLSIALSVNKIVSKIGTGEAKPNGELLVPAGEERAFLAPLEVGKMPSVGKETEHKLVIRGITTLGQLAEMPVDLLERLFGKHGLSLWERARGIDERAVEPYREAKSVSTERTFAEDIGDGAELRDRLTGLVTQLAYDLRADERLTANVAVKIRYSDFSTHTVQRQLPAASCNDSTLLRAAHELFDQSWQTNRPVRLLGVRFGDLKSGGAQGDLFNDTLREEQLLKGLDALRDRFGINAVMRAAMLKRKK